MIEVSEFLEYFAPDFNLCPPLARRQENQNSRQYLDSIRATACEILKLTACSPSVQMQDVPSDGLTLESDSESDPESVQT